jgi:hypothetical protein
VEQRERRKRGERKGNKPIRKSRSAKLCNHYKGERKREKEEEGEGERGSVSIVLQAFAIRPRYNVSMNKVNQ